MSSRRKNGKLPGCAVYPNVLDFEIGVVETRCRPKHPVLVTYAGTCLCKYLLIASVV